MDLRVANVSHGYGDVDVLRDIELEIPSGKIVCIIGPSGCGDEVRVSSTSCVYHTTYITYYILHI